ncbi:MULTISPECIES: hypothetical protein [Flavobacteriaceae]|uniref:hypothetical protein n=1 Tax=Flavobacteriaceae TaxID=49546 RepID=UPI003A8E60FB
MKKLSLLLALFSFISLFSQTVNDVPLKDIDVEYLQIVGTSKLLSDKVIIEIDFGQNTTFFATSRKETVVKDENGKNLKFNSMIDALNYLTKHGFKFVQAYAISIGNQNVYHYLMRKED